MSTAENATPDLRLATRPFRSPTVAMSLAQLASGFVPLFAIYAAMYAGLLLGVHYWALAGLSLLAGCFIVRIFIFQHDCGHGSFFRSSAANRWVGLLCSIVTLTPTRIGAVSTRVTTCTGTTSTTATAAATSTRPA